MQRTELLATYRTGYDAVARALQDAGEALDRDPGNGEWTARQVVHHLADSEATAYIRLRRLIAEDEPVIQAYDEPVWARRLHYDRPIEGSLAVVAAVRRASLELMEAMTPAEWERAGTHSASGPYSVDDWLRIYSDHSHDHADQVRRAIGD